MEKNAAEIELFQLYHLERYQREAFSADAYEEDDNFRELLEQWTSLEATRQFYGSSLAPFFFIDFTAAARQQASLLLSLRLGVQALGAYQAKQQIAQPKIYTRRVHENLWEIILDEYDRAFVFKYRTDKFIPLPTQVLRRKQ